MKTITRDQCKEAPNQGPTKRLMEDNFKHASEGKKALNLMRKENGLPPIDDPVADQVLTMFSED